MNAPDMSVVIPTFNRPRKLQRLLASLDAQTLHPDRFEVVVVDDGSPPDSQPPGSWFDDDRRRLCKQTNAGPAAARNRGARSAHGALLCFIDDDCIADEEWLESLWRAHLSSPDALLGGRTENGLPENPYSETSESLLTFFDEHAHSRGQSPALLASNNLAVSRTGFESIGGFDGHYPLAAGEDRDFCRRWARTGKPLARVPDACVRHMHALDLNGFWKQHMHYGQGAARYRAGRLAQDMNEATGGRFFHLQLLVHPLTAQRNWSWRQRLIMTGLSFTSQLAVTHGVLRERLARRQETK